MTSHVESQVQAAIAAARQKTQQQREEREAFAERRAAGLVARKAAKAKRVFCASCAKPKPAGTYKPCPLGCGAALCRTRYCTRKHAPYNCPTYQAVQGVGEAP
ncbi:hypothetical protein [Streptomyces griseoflavus]|uniref:hypothetical protein n=1 Tax=Streptomyces griseoflavus TaxID=35619 RepID=UPI0033DFB375